MRIILATLAVALFASSNSANAASASWRCEFTGFTEPVTLIAELGTGKGKFVGNQGTADVFVIEGTSAISFLEVLASGAVQVTTIVLKTGEAAHSRNTVISGFDEFMPSQAAGQCKPWN
jgi:hypothetical protein